MGLGDLARSDLADLQEIVVDIDKSEKGPARDEKDALN
jgi:hypothetical protein